LKREPLKRQKRHRIHPSRITLHASRFTLHASRFTHHASRFNASTNEHLHPARFHRRHAPERRQDHRVAGPDRCAATAFPRVGYIKPVGQRFVQIEEQKIDEDSVLMDSVYQLNCPLVT